MMNVIYSVVRKYEDGFVFEMYQNKVVGVFTSIEAAFSRIAKLIEKEINNNGIEHYKIVKSSYDVDDPRNDEQRTVACYVNGENGFEGVFTVGEVSDDAKETESNSVSLSSARRAMGYLEHIKYTDHQRLVRCVAHKDLQKTDDALKKARKSDKYLSDLIATSYVSLGKGFEIEFLHEFKQNGELKASDPVSEGQAKQLAKENNSDIRFVVKVLNEENLEMETVHSELLNNNNGWFNE